MDKKNKNEEVINCKIYENQKNSGYYYIKIMHQKCTQELLDYDFYDFCGSKIQKYYTLCCINDNFILNEKNFIMLKNNFPNRKLVFFDEHKKQQIDQPSYSSNIINIAKKYPLLFIVGTTTTAAGLFFYYKIHEIQFIFKEILKYLSLKSIKFLVFCHDYFEDDKSKMFLPKKIEENSKKIGFNHFDANHNHKKSNFFSKKFDFLKLNFIKPKSYSKTEFNFDTKKEEVSGFKLVDVCEDLKVKHSSNQDFCKVDLCDYYCYQNYLISQFENELKLSAIQSKILDEHNQ